MSSGSAVLGRIQGRRLTSAERMGLGLALAVVIHVILLLTLELTTRLSWAQPRTYLGSVDVVLDVSSPPVETQATVVPVPEPVRVAAAQPTAAQTEPRSQARVEPVAEPLAKPQAKPLAEPPAKPPVQESRPAEKPAAEPVPQPAAKPQETPPPRAEIATTRAQETPRAAAAQQPQAGAQPQGQQSAPPVQATPGSASVVERSGERAATSPGAAAPAQAASRASDAAPAREQGGSVAGQPGPRDEAYPSAGTARAAVSVPSAPPGSRASSEPAPLVDAPFNPFLARATETAKPSVAPQADTPLASGSGGAVGTAVKAGARAAPGSDLVSRAVGAQVSGGAGTPESSAGQAGARTEGSGSGDGQAAGSVGTGTVAAQPRPLLDPGGRYEVRSGSMEGRGVISDPQPDLAGLSTGGARITVRIKVMVAPSGIVTDPRIVQGAPNPEIDSRIRIAVNRWQFSPAPEGSGYVEATITFTIVPKS